MMRAGLKKAMKTNKALREVEKLGGMIMKVRYLGESDPLTFLNGKEYEVLGIENGMYRIIDEEGYDPEFDEIPGYLYSPDDFEIVSGSPDEFVDSFSEEE